MIQPPEDRRPPLTPQLALRVAVLGSFALAMFAIIFFRLWFLQVLSGQQYLAQARTNRVRDISVQAARGEILDSGGNVLVKSVPSTTVQISPPDLPSSPRARRREYRRLASVLGMSDKRSRCPVDGQGVHRLTPIACLIAQGVAQLPYANVTIKADVPNDVLYYLSERQSAFPGVTVQRAWLPSYPYHGLAAQLLGTVGRISCVSRSNCELHDPHFRGVNENDVVGQSGLEWYYNRYLQGVDGADRVQVNALGQFTGYLSEHKPIPGQNLKLSLNLNLEKTGTAALQQSIDSNPPAPAGAFVAMNPTNGAVYAMGSLPTFDPNIFAKPVSQSVYDQLNNASSGYPLFNRAIQSAYPTGSTFKGITATAALQSGAWSLGETYDDTGVYSQDGPGDLRHNAGHASYGVLDLTQAIMVSSDDFFYNLGRLMNSDAPKGGALQQWAHKYGIGRRTGIDLGGENNGILPTPEWRASRNRLEAECDNATGPFKGKPKHPPGGCGIADGTNRPWSVGDNENLAVGQGDLEATPLQLAVAYSAIENGGTVVRPHLGLEIDSSDGTLVQKIDPPAARHIQIASQNLDAIRLGLHEAASQPGGTSADVFANWPQSRYPVYGKTGTAQHANAADQAWYVCYVPDPVKPILVVVTVEQGGFGAIGAAPVAREILSQWFFGKPGQYVPGNSRTL
jgi:penicillin-binding protein 2